MTLPGIAGLDPDDRRRGRREHRHLRTREGGDPRRADRCPSRSATGYQQGPRRRSSTRTSSPSWSRSSSSSLATAGVKGFAFTLGVGTIVSLLTAVLLTQAVLGALGALAAPRAARARSAPQSTRQRFRWDFMGESKYFFSLSGVILLIGALVDRRQGPEPRDRLRVGHRASVAELQQSASEDEVRDALAPLGLGKAEDPADHRRGVRQQRRLPDLDRDAHAGRARARSSTALDKRVRAAAPTASRPIGPTFGDRSRRARSSRSSRRCS